MPDDSSANKRGAPRADAGFVIELYNEDGTTLRGIARLENLSVLGAGVESTSHLDSGTKLIIRLLLGKHRLLALPAEVVWVRPLPHTWEYGLRFGPYPETSRALITRFVQEYLGPSAPRP